MELTQALFNDIVTYSLGGVSDHKNPRKIVRNGIYFDKKKDTALILSPFTWIEISNLKIGSIIPDDTPFFNSPLNEFKPYPYKQSTEELFEEIGPFEPIGHVSFSATDIINVLEDSIREVRDIHENDRKRIDSPSMVKGRYIFVQGFLPDGCAPVKFRDLNGRPHFSIKNLSKPFSISANSTIPARDVVPGKCYACHVTEYESGFELDVISLFGKAKSGLYLPEDGYYNPFNEKVKEDVNQLNGLYTRLMVCSDLLEKNPDMFMPPIHMTPELLYDTLKIFMLSEIPIFNLVFQEHVNSHVLLENVPQNDDDLIIKAYIAVRGQDYGCQQG